MIRTIVGKVGVGTEEVFNLNDLTGLGDQVVIKKIIAVNDTSTNDIAIKVSSGLDTITVDSGTGSAEAVDIELSQNGLRDNRGVHSISIDSNTTEGKYYMVIHENNN